MKSDEIASYPALPADVAEWEDLLVRMEIMPRALRGTLEEIPGDERRLATLRGLLEREARVGEWLERVAIGAPATGGRPAPAESPGARWIADRFAGVRARNFAMLQRRGVDVWEWSGELDGEPVTVYQLLAWLVHADAGALAALREPAGPAGALSGVSAC
jgi:hypothetical protein